ncbi:MAG: hypothetical protein KA586_02325 [Candidatus Promineofilum sp.]|nr:hypothetical protein [Promineifilum sp.]
MAAGIGRALAGEDDDPGIESPGQQRADNLPLATNREDFFLPGTQSGGLTDPITVDTCDGCHTDPIFKAWRGSMMGQAGRDPVFWAAFAVAKNDAADAGEYCLRCHAPKAWYAARAGALDGGDLTPADISAGVACTVCHRMVDPVPGAADQVAQLDAGIRAALVSPPPTGHFATAMLILDPEDNRRGPFALDDNFNYHKARQARFQGQDDALAASRLCGSCHNVDNPLLSWNENPPGGGEPQYWPNDLHSPAGSFGKDELFPVERTYEEWLHSDYAARGVYAPQFAGAKPDGIVESCQDCHMVRTVGVAAETTFNPTYRDCATTGCLPAHIFVGGNSWVPKILQDSRWRLSNPADASALDQTAVQAQIMLRRAATLNLSVEEDAGQKIVTVRVINETGHKLPTGYPEGRRMWINLKAYNASGALLFESGAYDPATGVLTEDGSIKVYEVKQGLTPEMAAFAGLDAGPTFHFALNNTTIKDNRIPPRGYTVAAFDRPGMRPVGTDYEDGQFWDDTTYVVPGATSHIVATLYYQLSSGEYIEFLSDLGGADGATLRAIWEDSKSPPEIVARAEFPAPIQSYLPLSQRP